MNHGQASTHQYFESSPKLNRCLEDPLRRPPGSVAVWRSQNHVFVVDSAETEYRRARRTVERLLLAFGLLLLAIYTVAMLQSVAGPPSTIAGYEDSQGGSADSPSGSAIDISSWIQIRNGLWRLNV